MNRSVKADLTVTNCAYMYTSHPSLLVADVAAIKDRDDGLEFLTGNRPPPDLTGHDGRTFTVNVAAKSHQSDVLNFDRHPCRQVSQPY